MEPKEATHKNECNPNLNGPHSLLALKNNKFNKNSKCAGIYLWGVEHNSIYFPIYVGKGKNIIERLFQHIIRFSGGEYLIPDKSEIVNKDRDLKSLADSYKKNGCLPQGLLYFPTGSFDFKSFENNKQINETISFVKTKFFACWKAIPDYTEEKGAIEEGNLANTIGQRKLIGKRYKASNQNMIFIDDFLQLHLE
jgi:hypothetical protein